MLEMGFERFPAVWLTNNAVETRTDRSVTVEIHIHLALFLHSSGQKQVCFVVQTIPLRIACCPLSKCERDTFFCTHFTCFDAPFFPFWRAYLSGKFVWSLGKISLVLQLPVGSRRENMWWYVFPVRSRKLPEREGCVKWQFCQNGLPCELLWGKTKPKKKEQCDLRNHYAKVKIQNGDWGKM